MTDPQIKDVKPGDWIRTRDEDMDSTDEPVLDVVASVERRMRYVETWHGQRIPFDDIQEVRRAEQERDHWHKLADQRAARIIELDSKLDAQYDQAVEATQRALLAEQELNDFKEEKRNEI
jgi:hypothetical protein